MKHIASTHSNTSIGVLALCPVAVAFAENAPMTGRRSNNRRVFPEQEVYERLRPLVLFGETAASRAKETGESSRTLRYQADQFEQYGMASLFPKEPASPPESLAKPST